MTKKEFIQRAVIALASNEYYSASGFPMYAKIVEAAKDLASTVESEVGQFTPGREE